MYLYHLTFKISYFKWGEKYKNQSPSHMLVVVEPAF